MWQFVWNLLSDTIATIQQYALAVCDFAINFALSLFLEFFSYAIGLLPPGWSDNIRDALVHFILWIGPVLDFVTWLLPVHQAVIVVGALFVFGAFWDGLRAITKKTIPVT